MNSPIIYSYLRDCNIYDGLNLFFPNDIIDIIVKYIYTRNDNKLLIDIQNFVNIRNKLFDLYYKRFADPNILLFNDDGSYAQVTNDKYYLIDDLEMYYNTYDQFEKNEWYPRIGYFDIWKRKFGLSEKNVIQNYISKLNETNIDKQINIYLGLLNPNERQIFYNRQYLLYTVISSNIILENNLINDSDTNYISDSDSDSDSDYDYALNFIR